MTMLAALQERLGVNFADESLLRAALTHPSLARGDKKVSDYERLEFLGDRVLSLLIAEWLFEMYPAENEGELARRHAALVNRDTLAAIAAEMELAGSLNLVNAEDLKRGRVNILSDAMEAVIGAIYCDAGQKLDVLRTLIRRLWQPYIATATAPQDAKSALQEWAQGRGFPLPEYRVISQSGPPHAPTYIMTVQVQGQEPVEATGTSKREAEKRAAALLWEKVKTL
jgi:ribonuclease-3